MRGPKWEPLGTPQATFSILEIGLFTSISSLQDK